MCYDFGAILGGSKVFEELIGLSSVLFFLALDLDAAH